MKATENKKIYRFIIGALMAALLFTSLFFLFTASADAPTYTLENGVLTVYTMPLGDRASDYPWYPERSLVRKAVLKEGAGRLSASAFEGYPSLEEIIFPGGNNSIGNQALASCPSLFRIYFKAPVTSIGRAAFLGSKNIRVIVLTDQTKHDLEVLAALSPYNLAVNGGVETGLDTAAYVTFPTFYPGWYNDPSELTLAGRLTAAADTNRDGGVTIQDTTSLLDRLSGPDLDWTGRLDAVDGNSVTSITDLTALLNYLAGACVHRPERLASCEATCAEAGYEEYCRCADCGVELTVKREIAKKDHTVQYINAVAPGCTTDGHTDGRICSVCGEILKEQTVLPALGHDAAMIAGAAPTCTDSGLSEGSYCTRCGVTLAEQTTLPPLGHLPTVIAALPATCTVPGLTEGSECARCGAVLVPQQITSPLGHTPQTLLAVPATCTAFGLTEGSKCSVCGALLEAQTALPMLGHDFVDGVCTRCGEIEGVGDRFEIIRFGSYEQDNDLSNGSEEIEWIVLEKKDGKALLLSKYALEMKHYTTNYAFSWQSSTLRSWLNDDFYNAAFTDEEKSRIQLSSIYTEYSTDDRVFLLDLDDVTNPDYGFNADPHAQDSVRICHPTAYAVRDVDQPSGRCAWWLRTESDDGPLLVAYQMIAANNGSCTSTQAREDTCGVRPAMWIELEDIE